MVLQTCEHPQQTRSLNIWFTFTTLPVLGHRVSASVEILYPGVQHCLEVAELMQGVTAPEANPTTSEKPRINIRSIMKFERKWSADMNDSGLRMWTTVVSRYEWKWFPDINESGLLIWRDWSPIQTAWTTSRKSVVIIQRRNASTDHPPCRTSKD